MRMASKIDSAAYRAHPAESETLIAELCDARLPRPAGSETFTCEAVLRTSSLSPS